ncbi:hypothetical protein [Glycomyces algeriensis]|uniref:Uncharacterized protein n=1 Tax=Glycomyces algeriensis TaxID=256037 RepID=A0A9W6LIK0_9ACTN|nr:hypothetical protein [Glycomyces algeriensis]MDA1368624.1 hypothetical protein [Glycomyces algeriensis]MDR7352423.1 hypothetical protein [Glycomyces algeriensis]GLI45162.1 hypothetical protein GALLR39Z86_50120 [Glycomyces algeriensis]
MSNDADPPHAAVALEYISPEELELDPANPVGPELMMWCSLVLGAVALDPSRTLLVISGDFVASVRDRLEPGLREKYTTVRNDGTVGAKTMARPDGSVHVVIPADWFKAALIVDEPEQFESIVKRTIAHEAFHVAMIQAGEAESLFESEPHARRNFLVSAEEVISEFRAETAVAPELRAGDVPWDTIEALRSLRASLARIAAEYQVHGDENALEQGIFHECHIAWKVLALVALELRDFETGAIGTPPESVTSHYLWLRMAADQWGPFTDILATVPPGSHRIGRSTLYSRAAELADVLNDWLKLLGFHWVDLEDGHSFTVRSWDLLRPEDGR